MKTVLAIDVGFGNLKAVWGRSEPGQSEIRQWNEICFKAVVHPALVDEADTGMGGTDRLLVTARGNDFYIGPQATVGEGVRALHEDYVSTDEYEALIVGAWAYMFRDTQKVTSTIDMLVLGLPVSRFKAARSRLKEVGTRFRQVPIPENLRERHESRLIEVRAAKVLVLPQPFGGLRLACEDDQNSELFDKGVVSLVIDPGYNTFDWFVSDGMNPQLDLCGSFGGGVAKLLRKVAVKISMDHGIEAPNFAHVESSLVRGSMNAGFKSIDMRAYQILATQESRLAVSEFLQLFNPAKNHVGRIYLCGGGAEFYAQALRERLPGYDIQQMREPVMANARGFWLAAFDSVSQS